MVIGKLREISGDYSFGLYFVSGTLIVSAVICWMFGRRQTESSVTPTVS
jgi:ACS family tartrate transporter-like MFS transporter